MGVWQEDLETVGAELFQRYRKRMMLPGIATEIRRDYPGLSIADVLVRVHAARRIIRDGDDFRALQAIRSGDWQRIRQQHEIRRQTADVRRDGISRVLVTLGAVLFAGFCLLSLVALMSAGAGQWLVSASGLALAAVLLSWWNRSRAKPDGRTAETNLGCLKAPEI
jgi:hypothetical protein